MTMVVRLNEIKSIDLHGKRYQGQLNNRKCNIEGCKRSTKEGKFYCTDHVEESPYVQKLLERADRMQEEKDFAKRGRTRGRDYKLDGTSENIKDIVMHLALYGPRTIERLQRELNLEEKVVRTFVGWLGKRGKVTTSRTKRGSTVITLVGADPAYRIVDGEEEAGAA
jgi:hypothetical protein